MSNRYLFTFVLAINSIAAGAQVLISAQKINTYTRGELVLQGIFSAEYDVDLYRIEYNTVDVNGNPTTATGALAVPKGTDCDSFPLVNYNHGTVLLKSDVPSYQSGEELVGLAYASRGFITTMPDYLGLGDSPGLHPYQHAESEATATLDMIRASREYIPDSLSMELNGELFLTGYSQGGHAAMATHKYIQDNHLDGEFNVIVSAPASGAYDMSVTTANYIFSNTYSNPGYIVYLIESLQLAYGNIYNTRAEIYKSPYDVKIVPYLSGDSTMGQLNAALKPYIDSLIQDSVLNNYQTMPNHPLRKALENNDVYDWVPDVKVVMNYCEADEQVPYQNSIKTRDVMQSNGATDVTAISRGATYNHGGCVVPSLGAILDIFLANTNSCFGVHIGIEDGNARTIFNIYPNPAGEKAYIQLSSTDGKFNNQLVTVISVDGRIVDRIRVQEGKNELNISSYRKGVYFVQLSFSNEQIIQKLIVR